MYADQSPAYSTYVHIEYFMQLYPESWGQSASSVWGSQWVADHATSQKSANKPVIMEEFGVTSNQPAVYSAWFNTIETSGLAGDLIW